MQRGTRVEGAGHGAAALYAAAAPAMYELASQRTLPFEYVEQTE